MKRPSWLRPVARFVATMALVVTILAIQESAPWSIPGVFAVGLSMYVLGYAAGTGL